MNWLERKIFMYNVTVGLYMLDWWERYLINALLVLVTWHLVNQATGFSLKMLMTIISVFSKSSLGVALSWIGLYSTVNGTESVGSSIDNSAFQHATPSI